MKNFLFTLFLTFNVSIAHCMDITIVGLNCNKIITLDSNWTLVCIRSEENNKTYLLSITDNNKFIFETYVILLYRYPDDGGLVWWLNILNSGNMTKAQIIDSFINSAEYKNLH